MMLPEALIGREPNSFRTGRDYELFRGLNPLKTQITLGEGLGNSHYVPLGTFKIKRIDQRDHQEAACRYRTYGISAGQMTLFDVL